MVTGPALAATIATPHDGVQPLSARRNVRNSPVSPAVLVELSQKTDNDFATYRPSAPSRAQPGDKTKIREIVETRQEIRSQIQEQTLSLIKSYLNDDPALKESLEKIYRNNPEAAEQVGRGEIPDYFNVENTTRRILDIFFNRFEPGDDREEFAARARGIIEQAYGSVGATVGGLPGIVQDTHANILDILDRFAAGDDIADAVSRDLTLLELESDIRNDSGEIAE